MSRLLFGVVAANLLAVLVLCLGWPELMLAPGAVRSAHAAVARDCFACHSAGRGADASRCVGCHRVETIGVLTTADTPIVRTQAKPAFHQRLIEHDCLACHAEHRGRQRALGVRRFSHPLIEEAAREQCETCHAKPATRAHARLSSNCENCHSFTAWLPARFDHEKQFPLDSRHDVDCEVCHRGNDYAHYGCYGCHAHTPDTMRAVHADEGILRLDACAECHRGARPASASR